MAGRFYAQVIDQTHRLDDLGPGTSQTRRESSVLLKNKLHEPRHWELPDLPAELRKRSGILPLLTTLDPKVGPEIVLAIFDNTPFVFDLANLKPFDLHVKNGAVRTDHGPVIFLLFWLRDPRSRKPFAAWDVTLNPHDSQHAAPFLQLADQSHWHLFILGFAHTVQNMFEIENRYGLGESLQTLLGACRSLPCEDFDMAKREYEATYTIDDLFGAQ